MSTPPWTERWRERRSRFTAVTMTVMADAADRAQLEKLVTIAERSCIVANTLKDALPLTVVVA